MGEALIVVSGGGKVHAAETGDGRYRLVLPAKARIAWLGNNDRGLLAQGRFSPERLTRAWTALGHRRSDGVFTTLTWRTSAGKDAWALVRVSNPRVNGRGQLVIDALSSDALPRELAGYSVNVRRAAPTARTFPLVGRAVHLTEVVTMTTTALSAKTTTGVLSDGSKECWRYSHTGFSEDYWSGECGGTNFASITVMVKEATATDPGSEVAVYQIDSVPGRGGLFNFKNVQLVWDIDGNPVQ